MTMVTHTRSCIHQIIPPYAGPLHLVKNIMYYPRQRIRCCRWNVTEFVGLLSSCYNAQGFLGQFFITGNSFLEGLFDLGREIAVNLIEDTCPRNESATLREVCQNRSTCSHQSIYCSFAVMLL